MKGVSSQLFYKVKNACILASLLASPYQEVTNGLHSENNLVQDIWKDHNSYLHVLG